MIKWISEQWNKMDKIYPKAIYFIVGIMWFIVGALPYFGYPEPFKGEVGVKNFIILILSVLLLVIVTWIIIFFIKKDKDDIKTIIKKANQMLRDSRDENVLMLRNKWSRILWIEGYLYDRLTLGDIAKIAAINLQEDRSLAEIYIDDLGWTSVPIGYYKEARSFLESGLEYAKKIKDNDYKHYWLAKVKRHLAGIELEKSNYDESDKLMSEAILFANNIEKEQRKNEMLAGIYHMQAIRFLKENAQHKEDNIERSLEYAKKSEELIANGEKFRRIRIYSLKGYIYEAKGDKQNAEMQYRTGLKLSKELGRIDEIIINSFGLARILDNKDEKQQYLKTARKLLKKVPVPHIIDEKEMRLIR